MTGEQIAYIREAEDGSWEIVAGPVISEDISGAIWTYAADFSTTRDQIRVRIGDVDVNDPLLLDDEIAQAYVEGETVLKASLVAARWCAAKLAREFDKTIGKMSTKRSQRHAAMLQLIADLQEEIKQDAWSCTWSSARTMAAVTDTTAFPAFFRPTDTTTAREQEDD